ncbi:T9SS type A sorting domain-containing protein [Hymenobacter busanensis]|uniref:T9SS type A sorting domain-containing protein n=1 Tax=Hymenobacter busanensis TaxID=2607656 RepID=A0A7L4ZZG0_9BACT|nr:M4 family metallopeptidase [Hymenobacter busanensis]KAA9333160.1 T9SS type A sorting domain-containing protein [Hymenobacter busanensis]QHJ08165.1 T9SS type A sorting domain-containing protein [Hymenobacter busanensis]
MINKYPALVLALLGSALTLQAQDAARAPQTVQGADGLPELVQFRKGATPKLTDAKQALRTALALAPEADMRSVGSEVDQLGFTHEKFQQFYKGVKVEHATYSVHARNGAIETMTGDAEVVALDVRPSLSADAALKSALGFVRASRYMWQDAREEASLKQQENNPNASYLPKGELVIVNNQLSMDAAKAGKPTLAWKFNVYAQQPLSRAYIYVDANTGEVVMQDAIIKHTAANATFATAYNGTRTLANETTTGGYRLREYTRGLGIETYNARKSNSYTAAVDFVDADNNWTAAEYNNANYDNVAGDAHFGAQATYDYWKAVHNRNSYDNAGAKIKSYVHFDDVPGGAGYENAFWNGSVMTYGDGASSFKPLTAMDVCGHEIGHAVCEKTANLTYQNESGAMNEGFSDIWGACVEARAVAQYGLTGKSTFLIGEEIMKAGGALRSMSNPNQYGQPDTYKGSYWYTGTGDYGGVHTNSGVLNYWFYLLSQGGSGTNDKGSAYSVTGIGIDAAAKIAYRTESVYLTASSTYASARTAAISAATDLYGAGSAQVIATTNAWYAVGVGAVYSGGGGTTPPSTTTYCASKGTSQSYEWIDLVQLGSINRASSKDAGYYNGTATSTTVAAGSSQTIYFSAGFTSTAYTEYWKVYIDYNQNGVFTDAGELVVSGSSSSAATLSSTFTVPATAKSGATRLRIIMSDASATTSCSSYSYGETEDYTVNISGGTIAPAGLTGIRSAMPLGNEEARLARVFPNPATELLTILLPDNAPLRSVKVYDVRGAEMKQVRLAEDGGLDVSRLAPGMYQLSLSDGQKSFQQRFIKQ